MAGKAVINVKFLADLKEFSQKMQNANRSIKQMGRKMQSVGGTLSKGLTLPLLGFGAVAAKTFGDFEQEMAKVQAISGATAKEFENLKNSALDLGASTRFTAAEVAQLQLNYSKLGFTTSEILSATKATLDLSVATGEDLAESATVAASTLRAFGLDATKTNYVVDVMAKSFSSSALDLEKFKTAMAIVGPVAKTAGVGIAEATGMLSVLVNAGIDASTAGTGLRNIFLDIAQSGLTLDQALGQIQTATNKNAVAMDLFGKRGATVATVLANNIEQARGFATEYNNASGAAAKMAAVVDNTLEGSLKSLKSAVEGLLISFGEVLAPMLRSAAGFFAEIARKVKDLTPATRKFIIVLGGIAAAIGPIMVLAGTLLPALTTGFALLTGPIGLIVGLLTAVAVVIMKNWQPIKAQLVKIANYFVDLYNESFAFRFAVQQVILVFKNLYQIGKFVLSAIWSLLKSLGSSFANNFKLIGEIIKAVFTGRLGDIKGIVQKFGQNTKGTFTDLTSNLGANWQTLMEGLKTNTKEAFDAINQRAKIKPVIEAPVVSGEAKKDPLKAVETVAGTVSGGGPSKKRAVAASDGLTMKGLQGKQGEADTTPFAKVLTDWEMRLIDFNQTATAIVNQTSQQVIEGFGVMIAGLATGQLSLRDVAGGLMGIIGDMAIRLGKAAIAIGKAMAAIKLSFKNPFTAVAAGIALIAVGTMIKGVANNFSGGGRRGNFAGRFANGGVVGGASYTGDKLFAAVNSGEMILNRRQQSNLMGMLQGVGSVAPVEVTLLPSLEFSGEKLKVVLDRVDKKQRKTR